MDDTDDMHLMRWVIFGGLLCCVALGAVGGVVAEGAWNRVSSQPIDMTHVREQIGFQTPASVRTFIKRDGFAFRAHATLATLIARANGAPSAVGVQWVKAAAHARTDADLQQVVHGLQWAQLHSPDSVGLGSTLCAYVENGYWTGLQREAFAAVGIQCRRDMPRGAS